VRQHCWGCAACALSVASSIRRSVGRQFVAGRIAAPIDCAAGPRRCGATWPDMLDRVWNRQIEPGKVFDLELPLEQVADAYRTMDERCAIKALL
jgi:threonine dehydrogenase-like Zn-dependent dehydrogenase